jgi:hypothetical protein
MTVTQLIDPIANVETLLLELFQKVFQNDTARRHFGYSLISQATTSEGLPSWYLWFSEKRGAYSLTFIEGYVASDAIETYVHDRENDHVVGSRLVARYFPAVDEDTFGSMSCSEQNIRMGSDFDATGTPSFQGGRTIHESLFVAGYIDILIHPSKSDVDFFCSAPNRLSEYHLTGVTLTDERSVSSQIVSSGNVHGDFPGWDLSFFIFDKIISSFCFVSGQAPRQTAVALRPFFGYEMKTEAIFGVSFFNGTNEGILRKKSASFADCFHSQDYTLIGVWKCPDDIPAKWRKPEWWTIKTRHFHAEPDDVCSCYEDH